MTRRYVAAKLQPGEALIINRNGESQIAEVREPGERTPCSFERIYFSRGNDADIIVCAKGNKMLANNTRRR